MIFPNGFRRGYRDDLYLSQQDLQAWNTPIRVIPQHATYVPRYSGLRGKRTSRRIHYLTLSTKCSIHPEIGYIAKCKPSVSSTGETRSRSSSGCNCGSNGQCWHLKSPLFSRYSAGKEVKLLKASPCLYSIVPICWCYDPWHRSTRRKVAAATLEVLLIFSQKGSID